jgi:hypothetical protein
VVIYLSHDTHFSGTNLSLVSVLLQTSLEAILLGDESGVASMLPSWISAELKYGYEKYGCNNPQKSALTEGLHPGSEAFQDHFNYLTKFSVFYDNRDELGIGLMATQAVCKMALIATALVVSFPQRIHRIESPLQAFLEHEQSTLLQIPLLRSSGELNDPVEHAKTLEDHLGTIDIFLKNGQFAEAENAARQLLIVQCEYAIGHVSNLGYFSAPGLPSGDTELWPYQEFYS